MNTKLWTTVVQSLMVSLQLSKRKRQLLLKVFQSVERNNMQIMSF